LPTPAKVLEVHRYDALLTTIKTATELFLQIVIARTLARDDASVAIPSRPAFQRNSANPYYIGAPWKNLHKIFMVLTAGPPKLDLVK